MQLKDSTGHDVIPDEYIDEATREFRNLLRHRMAAAAKIYTLTGTLRLEDPGALMRRLDPLIQIHQPSNPMADLVGPFYDTSGVRAMLATSRQSINQRTQRGTLLGVQTSDGAWLYPTFQFAGKTLRPELVSVLRLLRDQPRWSVAVWLRGPTEDLDGQSPEQWLDTQQDPAIVERLARQTAHRWAA